MEWKKIITAIAALMLAYSLVGCVPKDEHRENINSKVDVIYKGTYDENGRYTKVDIVKDKETGVEYLLLSSGGGMAITPRLKGDE